MKTRQKLLASATGIALLVGCGSSAPEANLIDSTELDIKALELISSDAIAGLSIAIVAGHNKPIVWSGAYGVKDVETQAPVNQDTVFWLASVSKAVMGVSLMIAQEQGHLTLDTSVKTLTQADGGFAIANPDGRDITFRHLATHTSGIVDYDPSYACSYYVQDVDGQTESLANMLELDIDDTPVVCPDNGPTELPAFLSAYLSGDGRYYDLNRNFDSSPPGESYDYSNIGAALAGQALALATGQSLDEFARLNIFEPLGMTSTDWQVENLDSTNIATPTIVSDGEAVSLPGYELATWPDGGLRSTAKDLSKLLAMVMNGGQHGEDGASLVRADSIAQMLSEEDEYGVFWEPDHVASIDGVEHKMQGHEGSDFGAFSYMLFDPEKRVGIVLLANGDDDADSFDEEAVHELLMQMYSTGVSWVDSGVAQ